MKIESSRHAVLIFDWDDTICPSSFVDQWKIEHFKELPLHVRNDFIRRLCLFHAREREDGPEVWKLFTISNTLHLYAA